MKRINTQSLGSALDEFLDQHPELADKLAETRLMDAWNTTLGTSISRFTSNMYIRNRALYVKLNSAVVKSELLLCREQLVKKLNTHAGRNVIDNIVFSS